MMEKKFSRTAIFCAEILLFVSISLAQDLELNIKIVPRSPQTARIEGKFLRENITQSDKAWSFIDSLAGAENLGERISDLNLIDKQNRAVALKKLVAGVFLAENEASGWSYGININPSPNITAMAHVSWLKEEQGILMLGDLLPQFTAKNNQPISARIRFELPKGWKINSREKSLGENAFEVENIEKAVFLIGKNWRENEIKGDKISLNLAISDKWQFSDAEALQITKEIFEEYRKLFGEAPAAKAQIFLVRFPKETKFGRWEAETRGANITILSSDMPFKALSLQRLHEQLRHELFHLWIPNNLALAGNYDWFYEGFTVYQALQTGVQTNRIRFEDFLDTLSQAYNFDNLQSQKISLIEASKNRWNGANNQVYARGMIVAFLCDIALLRQSKGRNSIAEIFREIYQKHRLPNKMQDGNTTILKILENYTELRPIIEKYIQGTEKINWQSDLEGIGIKATETNFNVNLNVETKLKAWQKDLLNKLGYNNWRKISEK
ncbi:MAG: hypothetical protein LC768_13800 [Acidobacteria bacterium]|nr:hypothetical protein [Acidobacteriota bacterium]